MNGVAICNKLPHSYKQCRGAVRVLASCSDWGAERRFECWQAVLRRERMNIFDEEISIQFIVGG